MDPLQVYGRIWRNINFGIALGLLALCIAPMFRPDMAHQISEWENLYLRCIGSAYCLWHGIFFYDFLYFKVTGKRIGNANWPPIN